MRISRRTNKEKVFMRFIKPSAATILLGLVPFLPANKNSGQTNPIPLCADTRIEGKALMDDLDILEHAYKTMHAGLSIRPPKLT
jgi:hypothetical protein